MRQAVGKCLEFREQICWERLEYELHEGPQKEDALSLGAKSRLRSWEEEEFRLTASL